MRLRSNGRRLRCLAALVSTLALLLVAGCGDVEKRPPTKVQGTNGGEQIDGGRRVHVWSGVPSTGRFTDVTTASSIDFVHVSGRSQKKYMPETLGSGAAIADFDGDGLLDIYFANQRALEGVVDDSVSDRLWRQRSDGTFEDVTESSGIRELECSMGALAGDMDGDGDTDVYVLNLGRNTLWRNRGDGTFEDATMSSGVGDEEWSISGALFDFDRDGDLDLFVTNYVEFTVAGNVDCRTRGLLVYCTPHAYKSVANTVYRNGGDGRFTDVTAALGVDGALGKGMGIGIADFNDDGWCDVYVANDSVRNFLFLNRDGKRLEEVGLMTSTAYDESGVPQAGMGVDVGDLDGDGRTDILVTNLEREMNNAYIASDDEAFEDRARTNGLGPPSRPYVGFGIRAFDQDLDGDRDVFVTNGHILDNVSEIDRDQTHAQPLLFFGNDGKGRFTTDWSIASSLPQVVGRGLSTADFDDDGDLDVLITTNGGAPLLLRNDRDPATHWIGFDVRRTKGRGDPFGTTVVVTTEGRRRRETVGFGGSYGGSHDRRLLFGLGKVAAAVEVEVIRGDGKVEKLGPLEVDRYYTIEEGKPAAAPSRRH